MSAPTVTTGPVTHGGFSGILAGEWIKIRSVRTTWLTLLAGALLMAATAGQLAIYVANSNTNTDPADDAGIVTTGSVLIDSVELVQYAVLALGLLSITAEYATGTIRPTLQAVPSRGRLLLAKASVVAIVTYVSSLLLGTVGVAVAQPVLGGSGQSPAGETTGDLAATALYLTLVGLLALGLGAALRSPVLTLTVLFLTMTIVPVTLREPDIRVLTWIADGFPGVAGGHFLHPDDPPYPAPIGLLLLASWAAAALLAGWAVLRRRDA